MHIIVAQGVAADPEKVEVVRFVQVYRTMTRPLTQLLKKRSFLYRSTILIGFRSEQISDSLALSRPTSMTKIKARAEKHVEADEDKEDHLLAEKELPIIGKKSTPGLQAHQPYSLGGANHREEQRTQILKEVYHLHLLDMPPPIKRQLGSSWEERCEFHRTQGHTTENCRVLKSKIEGLIQEGCLGCFVKRSKNERPKTGELPKRDRCRTLG
ncbi:hypothetical protein CR513_01217, partial [Mucuna pruriens]